jgi:cob(I)alamin adenosyltransferase
LTPKLRIEDNFINDFLQIIYSQTRQNVDKLLDMLAVHAELFSKTVGEQDATNSEMGQLRGEVQDMRTDLLQLRAEFQQLHNDLSKICMILTTGSDSRLEFANSIFGEEFERLKESDDSLSQQKS